MFPTAISSEPAGTRASTQRSIGSAPCRATPPRTSCRSSPRTASAPRKAKTYALTFYGSSFIASHTGEKSPRRHRSERDGAHCGVLHLEQIPALSQAGRVFRDRRPDLYHHRCCLLDGTRPTLKLAAAPPQNLVFVDLETTGAIPGHDRHHRSRSGAHRHWRRGSRSGARSSTPTRRSRRTSRRLRASAMAWWRTRRVSPTSRPLVFEKLAGAVFVAHNARFDHGFLHRESCA